MPITIYNTLGRKKEEFQPITKNYVGFYSCGPTVYDYAHIGNLRSYIFEDILKRVLIFNGYKVKHVMNITDVDDKTIRRAKSEKTSLSKVTKRFTKIFLENIKELNIKSADIYCKATENIKPMREIVQKLLDKKIAYLPADGSIYFSIDKFSGYGDFAQLPKSGLKIGRRISQDSYGKKEMADFVLWKAWDKNDGEVFWNPIFTIGNKKIIIKGRPGWHIECSAMSKKFLGQPLDIHAGAVDLIFPHHQNEIAQSESAYNKKMAKYWIHGEHLLVDGKKMSKSLKNFYTLKDVSEKGFNPLAFRYLILNTHYRQKMNFSWKSLAAAQNTLAEIYGFLYSMFLENKKPAKIDNIKFQKYIKVTYGKFLDAIGDDLNTPKALGVMFEMIKKIWSEKWNNGGLSKNDLKIAKDLFLDFDKIFGLGYIDYLKNAKEEKLPDRINILIDKRERARIDKNFSLADKIRNEIEKSGYELMDTEDGPKIKRKINLA